MYNGGEMRATSRAYVNTFIITPKKEWLFDLRATDKKSKRRLVQAMTPKWHSSLFLRLLRMFPNAMELIDCVDYNAYDRLEMINKEFTKNRIDIHYYYYLLHDIRKVFFNTIMIIKNDFNISDFDKFVVVYSDDVCTDEQFQNQPEKNEICALVKHVNLAEQGHKI